MNSIAEMCAKRIKDIALDLEKTGRLCSLLNIEAQKSQGASQERTDMVIANRRLQASLEESLHELASMVDDDFGETQTNEKNRTFLLAKYEFLDSTPERKKFEQWYSCNAFDYEKNPVGSRECGLHWAAWIARATEPIAILAKPEPAAKVNNEGFIVEINEQLIEPGTLLYTEPPKRVPAAWRSKEQFSPDVGSWYEYYDAFREVNDTTGLTPLYE